MLGWGWVCATPVHAGQGGYGVGLSLMHDSNIRFVETNPQSDWTQSLIAGFFYQENTVDVTARILAQVERRHFYNQTFSDDTGGYVDGAVVWTILQRRLNWVVEDTFRDVQLNVSAPNTPANFGKANSLNTGPDFTLPMSSTNSMMIGGRYGRFDIQNSNTDNKREMVYVRALHNLSLQSKLSLNYETSRTYFEPGALAYDEVLRKDYFARFDSHSAFDSTLVDLGVSRLTQVGGPEVPGHIVRVAVLKALSSQSSFRVILSDQISDTFSDLIAGVTSSTAPTDPGAVAINVTPFATDDLYRSKRGEIDYLGDNGRLVYTLQTYGRQVDFETLDQDYKEVSGAFRLGYVFSGAIRFDAYTNYTKRRYDSLDRTDVDRIPGVGMTFRLNSNVTITLQGARYDRQSTAPGFSFVDNRVTLLLAYNSGPFEVRTRR